MLIRALDKRIYKDEACRHLDARPRSDIVEDTQYKVGRDPYLQEREDNVTREKLQLCGRHIQVEVHFKNRGTTAIRLLRVAC